MCFCDLFLFFTTTSIVSSVLLFCFQTSYEYIIPASHPSSEKFNCRTFFFVICCFWLIFGCSIGVYRSYKLLSSYKLRSKTQVFQICSLWREKKTTLFLIQVLNLSKKRIRNKVREKGSTIYLLCNALDRFQLFIVIHLFGVIYKNLGKFLLIQRLRYRREKQKKG